VKVYTAICGKYPIIRNDIDRFADVGIFQRPVMEAKRPKVLSHLFYPDEPITIWTDANVWLNVTPEEATELLLGDADMALFSHPFRQTVWQEFGALREQKRFQIQWLQQQLKLQEEAYWRDGLPENTPLYECTVLIRRNTESVARAMDAWWSQITRWQWRDQVSLPYVLWKYKVKTAVHAINVREHPMFKHVSQYG